MKATESYDILSSSESSGTAKAPFRPLVFLSLKDTCLGFYVGVSSSMFVTLIEGLLDSLSEYLIEHVE